MVARPKNRGGNVPWASDSPVIGTCCEPLQLFCRTGRAVTLHQAETAQMNSRVQYLRMDRPLQEEDVVQCAPCKKCAATLYMQGAPTATGTSTCDRSRSR